MKIKNKLIMFSLMLILTVSACIACDTDNACSHKGGVATCTHKAICDDCGKEYGELAAHKGGTVTCTEKAICSGCGEEYGNLAAHHFESGKCTECNADDPDYVEPCMFHWGGVATCIQKAICSNCGESYGTLDKHHFEDNECNVCNLAATAITSFEYSISNNKVTLTKFIGNETIVYIPDKIEGCSVTSIGGSAFYNCSSLTSVTIPNSVISIGNYAFSSCSLLTSITIPSSVTSIGSNTFYYCISLRSITIPNSVTSIGGSAFYNTGIWNNTPDNSIVYADKWVVGIKGTVTNFVLKDGAVGIGDSAFSSCSSLTSITIPAQSQV